MKLHVELVGLGSSSLMDFFVFWKMNGSEMDKEEREETPLQGEHESRRSSPPQEAEVEKEKEVGFCPNLTMNKKTTKNDYVLVFEYEMN